MIRRWFKSSLARTLASTGAAELLGAARGLQMRALHCVVVRRHAARLQQLRRDHFAGR